MKVFQFITEAFGWLQIVASPLVAGLIIGGLVYLAKRDTIGLSIGIGIALIGLIVGVIWATRVWRKKGTVDFMSRLLGTPELEKKESE
jgi:predicted membrane-bound dolichyl-phosphate-mannose-protein mannosyltransferase